MSGSRSFSGNEFHTDALATEKTAVCAQPIAWDNKLMTTGTVRRRCRMGTLDSHMQLMGLFCCQPVCLEIVASQAPRFIH